MRFSDCIIAMCFLLCMLFSLVVQHFIFYLFIFGLIKNKKNGFNQSESDGVEKDDLLTSAPITK